MPVSSIFTRTWPKYSVWPSASSTSTFTLYAFADEDLEPAKLRLRPIESCRLGIAVDDDGADLDADGRSRRKIVFLAVFLQNDLDWIVLFDICRLDMVEALQWLNTVNTHGVTSQWIYEILRGLSDSVHHGMNHVTVRNY